MVTYNVILHKGVDYQSFWDDMENENDGGNLYIPNRTVDSPNQRLNSQRQTWYTLSEEEAENVRNDERVFVVEIPPENRDDIIIRHHETQSGTFTKTTSDSGNYQNWGLIRALSKDNIYGTSTTTSENYTYTLTGKGVDVVTQDSGMQTDHPEWVDRFESVDWGTYGAFTQNANHDRDFDGHGSHCAGIAVGKTFGFAKGSKVFNQKISGLEGSGDNGTGISPSFAFDAIKGWHNAKPIDTITGYKRPTVVNMSWGYSTSLTNDNITAINYRGTSYTGGDIDTAGERESNYGLMESQATATVYRANVRILSIDTDIEELLDAGVHVCVAAGNRSNKADEVGGDDYNNTFSIGSGNKYYHRGSSPYGDAAMNGSQRAIIVGNIDSSVSSGTLDRKATSSETGPGVDIYAAGTNIMSSTSTTNRWGGGSQNYTLNTNFKQTNITGTSMASPQVAGVLACILELHPEFTPAQGKQWLLDNAGSAILNTGTGNDWTNDRSLKGGEAKVLYMPFSNPTPIKVTGLPITFNLSIKER
jgi:subtilisin family serine protease|tara:strand:+ start:1327 stop:2919 length:1593 start_codon:yes stop_codon:yes gene_type:complete